MEDVNKELADRLQLIEDRAAIWSLVREFGRAIDAGDLAGVAALFGTSGRLSSVIGPSAAGAAAIEAVLKNALSEPGPFPTCHLISNFMLELDGDLGRGGARWTLLGNHPDGPRLLMAGHYIDTYSRVEGGWTFAERTVINDSPLPPAAD